MSNSLNDPSMFRKGGLLLSERGNEIKFETGRDPLDGSYYVNLRRDDGLELRAIMTPQQFFNMCCGGLSAMARWGFPEAAVIVKNWTAPR